jgi:hypothetical protein
MERSAMTLLIMYLGCRRLRLVQHIDQQCRRLLLKLKNLSYHSQLRKFLLVISLAPLSI